MAEWQDISSAPKDDTLVLLWEPSDYGGRILLGSFRTDESDEDGDPLWLQNDHDDWSTGYFSTPSSPSHWMPLPPPPPEAT